MKPFKNLSIGAKLLIVLLLISLLPLFVVTSGFYRLGKSKLTKQTIRILDVQAKNTSAEINSYINFKFKLTKMTLLFTLFIFISNALFTI